MPSVRQGGCDGCQARQRVAAFLQPTDEQYFDAAGRPVALFDFTSGMRERNAQSRARRCVSPGERVFVRERRVTITVYSYERVSVHTSLRCAHTVYADARVLLSYASIAIWPMSAAPGRERPVVCTVLSHTTHSETQAAVTI